MSTPDTTLVPEPTAGEADPNKRYLTLDIRSTVLNPLDQYPTDIFIAVTNRTIIPDTANTPVYPTGAFKTIVYYITEALLFLSAHIYYETETVLLHLEDLNQ